MCCKYIFFDFNALIIKKLYLSIQTPPTHPSTHPTPHQPRPYSRQAFVVQNGAINESRPKLSHQRGLFHLRILHCNSKLNGIPFALIPISIMWSPQTFADDIIPCQKSYISMKFHSIIIIPGNKFKQSFAKCRPFRHSLNVWSHAESSLRTII